MTGKELQWRLNVERHYAGHLHIVIGWECCAPSVLGMYEKNSSWFVYKTGCGGQFCVLAKGTEEEMADVLYQQVLKAERQYKERKWWENLHENNPW
jgi:hypothetical protein